jgi:hypothetical protein
LLEMAKRRISDFDSHGEAKELEWRQRIPANADLPTYGSS